MATVDEKANQLFDELLFGKTVLFRPCENHDLGEKHACHICYTTLEYAYMENRLYALRCPKCEKVSFVRQSCVSEAADLIGNCYSMEDDDGTR